LDISLEIGYWKLIEMFNYFSEIKKRDEATKQRFVVVATAISFIAIIAIWVPIRIAQWRTPGNATVAKTEEVAPATTATPAVAGDDIMRIISGDSAVKATAVPVSSIEPLFTNPMATAMPVTFDSEVVPEVVPAPTDFPTL